MSSSKKQALKVKRKEGGEGNSLLIPALLPSIRGLLSELMTALFQNFLVARNNWPQGYNEKAT